MITETTTRCTNPFQMSLDIFEKIEFHKIRFLIIEKYLIKFFEIINLFFPYPGSTPIIKKSDSF